MTKMMSCRPISTEWRRRRNKKIINFYSHSFILIIKLNIKKSYTQGTGDLSWNIPRHSVRQGYIYYHCNCNLPMLIDVGLHGWQKQNKKVT